MAGVAGLGGMPPKPLNAPQGVTPASGVQPGQSPGVVIANRVIITGPNGELLVYAGAAAFGKLIESITGYIPGNPVTATFNDPYGNAVLPGSVAYSLGPAGITAVQNINGSVNFLQAATSAGPYAVVTQVFLGQTDLPGLPVGTFLTGPVEISGALIAKNPAGLIGSLPIVQADTGTYPNANQATVQPLSKAWTVPANDAQAGTVYEIEADWDALTVAGNPLRLGLSVDGAAANLIEASIVPGAVSPNGMVKAKVQVLTTGAGGTVNAFIMGTMTPNATNTTPAASMGFSGTDRAKGVALDTTVAHTLTLHSFWPTSSATQTVSGYGSKFTRSGP